MNLEEESSRHRKCQCKGPEVWGRAGSQKKKSQHDRVTVGTQSCPLKDKKRFQVFTVRIFAQGHGITHFILLKGWLAIPICEDRTAGRNPRQGLKGSHHNPPTADDGDQGHRRQWRGCKVFGLQMSWTQHH